MRASVCPAFLPRNSSEVGEALGTKTEGQSFECQSDEDCTGGRQCVDGFCTTPEVVRCEPSGPVRFPFNQASLTSEAQSNLQALADCLQSNQYSGASVVIEGHADERGTDEYNLALAERRAKVTRDQLVERGIAVSRITIVPYGEERPACTARSEACWAQNRRAHFLVQ